MRRIKIEIDGQWYVMSWSDQHEAIRLGNDLTHYNVKLSTNRYDRDGIELFEGDKIILFNPLYTFEYEIMWNEDDLTFIAWNSGEFLYPDDWHDFKIIQ